MLKLIRLMAGSNVSCLYGPLALSVAILGAQAASCFAVYFLLRIFSENGPSTPLMETAFVCLLLVLLFVAYYALVRVFVRQSMISGYRIVADLRARVCDHIRRLPLAFFRKNDPSVLSGVLLRNMSDAEGFFGMYVYEMTACAIVPLALGLIMACMDWRVAAAMSGMVLLAVPVALLSSREAAKESPAYVAATAKLDAALLEYLGGIGELKGAGRTGVAFTPYVESNDRLLALSLAMEAKFSLTGQLFLAALDLVFVAALTAGALLLADGSLHVAVFALFLLAAGRLVDPLQNLGAFATVFRFTLASMKRITLVLREKTLPVRAGGAEPHGNAVDFCDVSFAYGEKDVLSGISFSIPEGRVTALVGESGGGKSTIANLLLRFWDVRAGSIRIGGADIRTLSPDALYARFSAVFQDVYLFNDTVMNNIRLARPGATDAEVLEASRLACCHEFITALENGYETPVGERGSRLSGGERQRIAIARAILKNAPILILDEATASVDPENELQIQQGLTNLTRGKTLLVIAHRLATIREADQILVLSGGRIAERGVHDELAAAGGIYTRLWESQEKLKSWKVQ